jgi:hypothetical protein
MSTRRPRKRAFARAALGGNTTMTLADAKGANIRNVLPSSVSPRRVDSALNLPRRAEKPADSTTMRSPAAEFVGIITR